MNLMIENIQTNKITRDDDSFGRFHFPINITFDVKFEDQILGSCDISMVNSFLQVEITDLQQNSLTFKPSKPPISSIHIATDVNNLNNSINQMENVLPNENCKQMDISVIL